MGEVRDEITAAELRELQRTVQETRWLTEAILRQLVKKESADRIINSVQDWLNGGQGRFKRGTPVWEVCPEQSTTYAALIEADLYTLEEVAAKPRREVAAVEGVGRVTMRHLEAAMAERGLTWAEVA